MDPDHDSETLSRSMMPLTSVCLFPHQTSYSQEKRFINSHHVENGHVMLRSAVCMAAVSQIKWQTITKRSFALPVQADKLVNNMCHVHCHSNRRWRRVIIYFLLKIGVAILNAVFGFQSESSRSKDNYLKRCDCTQYRTRLSSKDTAENYVKL